jgi:protein-tyrosine phosphatase
MDQLPKSTKGNEKKLTNKRTLHVDGLVNARDLGGLLLKDGSRSPYGVFYRSENADQIKPAGWDQLKETGIRTIVDLRQQDERDKDTQPRPEWLTTIHSDLDGLDNDEFWNNYWEQGLASTALYYLPHLKAMPERASAALDAIVTAPEGGVLFHCKSGRDRTGLISLLLLSAIDTEPEEIVDDYLETVRLGDIRGKSTNRSNPEPALEQLCRKYGTTTEGAFRAVINELEYSHFIKEAGLSNTAMSALATWRGSVHKQTS